MTDNEQYVEVCEGFCRNTPPTMIPRDQLPQWKAAHESSTTGLSASIFSYLTPAQFGISTISTPAAVKNPPINKLKTSLKRQMGSKLADFSGNRSEPYICYMHKGGN